MLQGPGVMQRPDTGTEHMHHFYCRYHCTASSWWTPHTSRHPWVVLDQPRPKLKVWSHSEQHSRFLLYVIQQFFLTSSACHCATKSEVAVALKLEEFLSILLRVNNIFKKTKTNKLATTSPSQGTVLLSYLVCCATQAAHYKLFARNTQTGINSGFTGVYFILWINIHFVL